MRTYVVILLVTLFLIVSCAPQTQPTEEKQQDTVVPEEEVVEPKEDVVQEVTEPIEEVKQEYSKEVKELLDRSKNTVNYRYFFDYRVRNEYGNYDDLADYEVYIKGSKIKKVYPNHVKLGVGAYYNEVYMDSEQKTAFAICTNSKAKCDPIKENAYKLSYGAEKLPFTPVGIMQSISYEAEKIGEETFDNRKTAIIQYINDKGRKEKVYIDTYYGLPLRRIVYITEVDEDKTLEENAFTSISVGSVKEADVTLPDGYTVVE